MRETWKAYRIYVKQYGGSFQFKALAPISLWFMEKIKLRDRFPRSWFKLQYDISLLYGDKHAIHYSTMFIAQVCSAMILLLFIFLFLSIMSKEASLFVWGLVITTLLPLVMLKDLEKKIKNRKREIVLELPILLNKMTLLVNAGETIQRAIIRSSEAMSQKQNHPLYGELHILCKQLHNNYSFQQAMEEFNRRCRVQEVSVFTNTILLHYRRGGADFVAALSALSHQLWSSRRAMAKILGEEASAKLVFPLVLIFIVVMLIVAAPAVFMMKF